MKSKNEEENVFDAMSASGNGASDEAAGMHITPNLDCQKHDIAESNSNCSFTVDGKLRGNPSRSMPLAWAQQSVEKKYTIRIFQERQILRKSHIVL